MAKPLIVYFGYFIYLLSINSYVKKDYLEFNGDKYNCRFWLF
jgi:hypothetical protein